MTRRADWPERVVAVLDAVRDAPFAFGTSDCFTLAMDVVEAITGLDPWASERGRYRGGAGAARRLRAAGFGSIADLLATIGREIPASFAGRGDLGVTTGADGSDAIAVCDGARWVGRAEGLGTVVLPRDRVRRVWRVE